jgi:PKD domain/Bacterial Ig domain/Papain family cysteine protease
MLIPKKSFLLSIALLSFQLPAFSQSTGLHPLTSKELKYMQKTHGMKKIKSVSPNGLGLKRANQERNLRGLPALPAGLAKKMGQETETDADLENDFSLGGGTSDVTTDGYGGVLPTTVDNSTLPSFPSIGNQAWASCVGWAMGYYQFSHNTGLALGWNNKTDLTKKCSPKFVYNMINSGSNNGAYFSDAFALMQKHGCITNSNFPEDSNYRNWDLNPDHWQSVIPYRSNAVQYIYNVDTQAGLDQIKQMLSNGYVLTYGTYIDSWQYSTIKSNPATTSNPLSGQQVLSYVNGTNGSHAMTIVGYDDSAWTDLNANNIVDSGELGVFKIANSWGTSWGRSGFMLVAYDALKSVSAISGGPSSGRQPAFQSRLVYHLPPRGVYTPKYLAKFTMKHAARNQLSLKFGWSLPSSNSATTTITPFALMNKGGAYAFNGTTTAVDGTFVMDVSELPISSTTENIVYLTMSDSLSGTAGTLSNFQMLDLSKGSQVASSSPAVTADASSATMSMNYISSIANSAPVAMISASSINGTTPLIVNFDGGSSYDPDGTISSYLWNFGDGTQASGAYASKTFNTAGTFNTVLTVTDNSGTTSTKNISITASAPVATPITDTSPPTVTLTAPLNGSKFASRTTVYGTATASDNVGVYKVRFYVNGYLKCTDYNAPYSCSWRMVNGTKISVKATAYDAAGNYASSPISYISN